MAQEKNIQPPAAAAFTNVALITMEGEDLLEKQTLLVEGARIGPFGPTADLQVPAGATVIDGTGCFLMPGLANMHAHLYDFDSDPRHLSLYLAGGVTTLRSLNSWREIATWQEKIGGGAWLGPVIFRSGRVIVGFPDELRMLALGMRAAVFLAVVLAGMLILGALTAVLALFNGADAAMETASRWVWPWLALSVLAAVIVVWRKIIPLTPFVARFHPQAAVVETPGQARAEVTKQAQDGVDLIKVYDYLNEETYFAALAAARENGLYTTGHIPEDPDFISVEAALTAGLNELAHVDEATHEFLVDFDPGSQKSMDWEIDMDRIDEIAATVARHEAAVTTTLVTNETVLLGLEDVDALFEKPQYRLIKPDKLAAWREKGRMVNWKGQETYRRQKLRPLWMGLTKALHDHGVPLLLGTDSDVECIVPGASEHGELALLVEAGLSPFEALAAGTRNAALITGRMKQDDKWGTIKTGNYADLVLLSENPLLDIANSTSVVGVMVHGRWLPKAELDGLVAEYLKGS